MHKRAGPIIITVLLAIPACSSGDDNSDQRNTSSTNQPAATNTIDLQLGDGADSASTTFQAQDPRTHGQTVEIEITPTDAAITLDFVTADGATLHVLSPPLDNTCNTTNNQWSCTIRFPILEARSPGQWRAVASKPDGPPAALNITVAWEQNGL